MRRSARHVAARQAGGQVTAVYAERVFIIHRPRARCGEPDRIINAPVGFDDNTTNITVRRVSPELVDNNARRFVVNLKRISGRAR